MKKLYHYPVMCLLTFLGIIALLVFEATAFLTMVLFEPKVYSYALDKHLVAGAVYDDLDSYFEKFYSPTGIPKEVFMNSITEEKINEAIHALTASSLKYLTSNIAPAPRMTYDFTQLESDVRQYVEENSDADDPEYDKLIDNTIRVAEQQITDRLDVIMLYKLSNSKFADTLHKYPKVIGTVKLLSAIAMGIILVLMFIVNRHHPRDMTYWIGTVLFCSSGLLLIPTVYLKKIKFFDSFMVRSEHVYRSVTGILNSMLEEIITTQVIMLVIGILLIVATIVIHVLYKRYCKKKARAKRNAA